MSLISAALAVLLPVECAGCGVPDRVLCGDCAVRLAARPRFRVLRDGTRVGYALDYGGPARRAVLALKEQGSPVLAARLAPALVAACRLVVPAGEPPVELVPVPSSPAASRRRGYSPVVMLARSGGLALRPALRSEPGRGEQKTLGAAEREANRRGGFRVALPVAGRRILLVDDVVTTGATLVAAALELRAAGAEVVGAAVLAATPRHIP